MTEILFYHLTESTLEAALPPLLEKCLQRGWRAVVRSGSEERRDALDSHLWVFREQSFIGHGTDKEKHAVHLPVLLTTGEGNPNAAQVCFLIDNAVPSHLADYDRAVFLFDGNDNDQVEAARAQWKSARTEGHEVTYWQQTREGRWERKA